MSDGTVRAAERLDLLTAETSEGAQELHELSPRLKIQHPNVFPKIGAAESFAILLPAAVHNVRSSPVGKIQKWRRLRAVGELKTKCSTS